MTEQPHPGWWQASDGNWYPPQTAPQTTVVVQQKKGSGAKVVLWLLAILIGIPLLWAAA